MHYYGVAVSSSKYHGLDYLTYSSKEKLLLGTVVAVPLRQQLVLGIVMETADQQHSGKIKPIEKVISPRPLPSSSLQLLQWLRDYYPAGIGVITQHFVPSWLLKAEVTKPGLNAQTKQVATKNLPPLTDEQHSVLASIKKDGAHHFLLHGETGSGKTRVYIELAKKSLSSGRSAIILTPEISLTPQLVKTFEQTFGDRVLVTHSSLTDKQRRLIWLRALGGEPLVLIGPRSALFAPLGKLGLIVVDEAHEPAYKQEKSPYYQSTRVASALAAIHGAKLILGSATPLIADYFVAEQKKLPILRMKNQALTKKPPSNKNVHLIDLREKNLFSRHPYLSNPLLSAIETALSKHEQALVFLNRRGTARLIVCQSCGWQAMCENCNLPLTYHSDTHGLLCHTCGFGAEAPSSCKVCSSSDIIFKGIGTKALESSLAKLFPRATIKRFDADNTKSERLEAHFGQIASGEVDILIGTQILAKGLDLPHLSVVGVIIADSSLSFPDYTAEERTYQLLRQVLGRVGRGHRAGQVFVQTYNAKSPTLLSAIDANWEVFYRQQLDQRRQFGFPPFNHMLKLSTGRASPDKAQAASSKLAAELAGKGVSVIGPAPCFKEKIGSKYWWQIVVKSKQRGRLTEIVKSLPSGWTYDLDPANLL